MAFLFRRNSYYVLIDKKKGLWKKLGKISFVEANKVLQNYLNKKTRFDVGLPIPAVKITFQELVDEYLADIAGIKARSTVEKEKWCLSYLCKNLGPLKIGEITSKTLEGLLQSQDLRPATFHDRAKVLRGLFKMAVSKQYIETSPAIGIRLPKLDELPPRAVSPALIDKVFKHMTGPILAYYKLLYYTGMRPGEAIRLRSKNVDLQNMRIFVVKSKSKRFRVIPIHKDVVGFLKPLLVNDYLFPGDEDGHQKSMKSGLDRAIKNAKIKGQGLCRYAIRHTFATQVLSKTGNLRAVQTLLGHSKSTMTERYAHVLNEQLKEAVGTL